MDVWLLWAMRVGWVLLPLVGGPSVAAAFGDSATGTTATVLAWAGFALGLIAMAVPRSLSLTIVRIVVPASVPLAAFTIVRTEAEAGALVMLGLAGLVTVLALLADVGNRFAAGSSYGPERRMLLRPPAAVALGVVPIAWVVLLAGVISGPLLLADRRWVLGAAAVAIGLPVAFFLFIALHRLTQRWLVFVPAGLVVVDHIALTDPVLVPSGYIEAIGPAAVDAVDGLADLTADAAGLVLGITTNEPLVIARSTPGDEPTVTESTPGLLVSPSRPGAVLAEAESRGLPVGDPQPIKP
jgi:hypothetical protein